MINYLSNSSQLMPRPTRVRNKIITSLSIPEYRNSRYYRKKWRKWIQGRTWLGNKKFTF